MRASTPPVASRRGGCEPDTARRAATRERLVDAAFDVFAEVGLPAATVEQVAERAGFTRGAFYSNFTSKEELFLALVEKQTFSRIAGLTERLEAMRPHLASHLDEEQLAELLLDVLCWAMSDRRWTIIVDDFRLMALRDHALAADFVQMRDRMVASVRQIIEQALDGTGRVFTVDPNLAVRLLINTYLDSVRDDLLDGVAEDDTGHLRLTLARLVLTLTRTGHEGGGPTVTGQVAAGPVTETAAESSAGAVHPG
ncbi:TetR/AcrR family transcriptional regulator [Cellulomonas citrea]|uniref:TetR/AcrR family transcriptional regulator n=1 Tax=Cellulomonas citrea TaxID=1909423 RepID=UPI001F196D9D|nr:TetR/AcrR family transcriptional regulator [Cellulomonas citrea]